MMSPEFKSEVQSGWAKLDAGKRKLVLFVPCLLLALFIATHPHPFRRTAVPQVVNVRPSDAAAMQRRMPAVQQTGVPAADALQSPGAFAGRYQARGNVGQNLCVLTLEIRTVEQEKFTAYPALSCMDLGAMMQPKPGYNPLLAIQKASPMTAILSGRWKEGAVEFRADKVTSADSGGCAMAFLTATPFGMNQLAVSWKYSGCANEGGHMLLDRQAAPRRTL